MQWSGQFPSSVQVADIDPGGGKLRGIRTHYEILGVSATASAQEL